MKNHKAITATIFALAMSLAITVNKLNSSNSEKENSVSAKESTDSVVSPLVKEANMQFKAGKVIELAYVSVEGGKEGQLNQEYFAKILPIAAEYGGKMLGSLRVTAVTEGKMFPQMIAIFEWPELAARDKLLADKRAQKLFPVRDEALTFIKLAYFTVEQDVMVTFKEDKTYEFFNAWLTPASETALPEYFKQSDAPKKKYGSPAFLASFKPIKLPAADYLVQPHMSGIVEWSSTNAYYGLIADPDFKKAAPLLKKSLTRIDGLHAKFNFPQ